MMFKLSYGTIVMGARHADRNTIHYIMIKSWIMMFKLSYGTFVVDHQHRIRRLPPLSPDSEGSGLE